MIAAALALLLAGSPLLLGAQEYYEPVPKLRREHAALEQARVRVQAKIDETSTAIRQDSAGFYKAHASDCEIKGAKRADGTFDYVYVPSRAWLAERKRLVKEIQDKAADLLAAYDAAIAELGALEDRLVLREKAWKRSVDGLEKVGADLEAEQAEWRSATLIAGCELVNESIPLMREGLGGMGIRLIRPPKGSVFSKVPLEKRKALQGAIGKLETLSGAAAHAGKAYMAARESASEKDLNDRDRDVVEAGIQTTELCGDILKEVAHTLEPAELEEFKRAYGAVVAFVKIVKFGSGLAVSGEMDEKTRIDLSDAAVSIVKFAGEFNPAVLAGSMIFGAGSALFEGGLAGSTWWQVWGDARRNRSNLERARVMLTGVRGELEQARSKLRRYRDERAELAAKAER